jgi:hypothetical protein
MANTSVFLGRGGDVSVDAGLSGVGSLIDPLTVNVDGSTLGVNGSNELTVPTDADLTVASVQSAYKAADGTAGASAGPFTVVTAIRVKNGLVTTLTGT